MFGWVLKLVAEHGLVKGERIGVDGSTMEANAALRTIVRRDNGETYREMLTRMAKESGIETPSAEDLVRFDRKRKGKTLSNADWKTGEWVWTSDREQSVMLVTVLNFAAALAGLIAAWRWHRTTTIKPPTELSFGGPTTVDTPLSHSSRRSAD